MLINTDHNSLKISVNNCDDKIRAIRNNFTYEVAKRFKGGKYFSFGFKTIF